MPYNYISTIATIGQLSVLTISSMVHQPLIISLGSLIWYYHGYASFRGDSINARERVFGPDLTELMLNSHVNVGREKGKLSNFDLAGAGMAVVTPFTDFVDYDKDLLNELANIFKKGDSKSSLLPRLKDKVDDWGLSKELRIKRKISKQDVKKSKLEVEIGGWVTNDASFGVLTKSKPKLKFSFGVAEQSGKLKKVTPSELITIRKNATVGKTSKDWGIKDANDVKDKFVPTRYNEKIDGEAEIPFQEDYAILVYNCYDGKKTFSVMGCHGAATSVGPYCYVKADRLENGQLIKDVREETKEGYFEAVIRYKFKERDQEKKRGQPFWGIPPNPAYIEKMTVEKAYSIKELNCF